MGGATKLDLCLYDASSTAQPLLTGEVLGGGTCGSKPCWKALGSGGYRYKNKAGSVDGFTDVKLRVSSGGEIGLVVKGKGAGLSMPVLGLVTPVQLQLLVRDGSGTTCWESRFTGAVKNDPALFKANGS